MGRWSTLLWRRDFSIALPLLLAACAPPAPTAVPDNAGFAALDARPVAEASRHMVAAANPLAAKAGLDVLRKGGSAVDAVIAMQMVLTLVEPQSSGIGGSAFLVHFDAKTGEILSYDGRETAPRAATEDMFLDPAGGVKKRGNVRAGGLAVGVPGLLRMLELAHRKHGRLSWKSLFAPAIALAEKGFAISPRLNESIQSDRHLKDFPAARAYFFDEKGAARAVGTILVNAPLAESLRVIADKGADAFYSGDIARDVAATVRNATRNPGPMTEADIASYEAKGRTPVCAPYRVWLVCGMGPPSTGGVTTLQILGLLERFDLASLAPGSLEAVHLISEASRLAYADRYVYLADSDFVRVPIQALLDPVYIATRSALISPTHSIGKAEPGKPERRGVRRPAPAEDVEAPSTTHLSVIDANGNAAAMTSSVGGPFGSMLMVRGFMLNNQLTDFTFRPRIDGAPVVNRPGPRKRPRSSMSPTLVFDNGGKLVLTVGSPGGSRIIAYVVKTLIAVLDWGLDIQRAISLPNHVNRNGRTDLEEGTALVALAEALEAKGHDVRIRPLVSGLQGIAVTGSRLYGGADPRREGVALGD